MLSISNENRTAFKKSLEESLEIKGLNDSIEKVMQMKVEKPHNNRYKFKLPGSHVRV